MSAHPCPYQAGTASRCPGRKQLWLFEYSSWVDKKAVDMFQSQNLVDGSSVVEASCEMALHDSFDLLSIQVRSRKRAWIQQHFPNVPGEGIPIPHPKMIKLVPAEEKSLEVEQRKQMIASGHPLRHAVVVGVLRLDSEFEETSHGR